MDREFLEDYNRKEFQETREMCIRVSEKKFMPDERYPPANRFSKLEEPVGLAAHEVSIWPQIPLFGSLVIPLLPVSEDKFPKIHGFDIRDIAKLIDFSKDTGKVQFGLSASPIAYAGLDFLDQIFIELKPPTLSIPPPMSIFGYNRERDHIYEFSELAHTPNVKIGMCAVDLLKNQLSSIPQMPEMVALEPFASTYVNLKCLGYEKAALKIEDLLIDDPLNAWVMLMILDKVLVNPIVSPFKAINCLSKKFLSTCYKTEYITMVNGELISFSPSQFNLYKTFKRLDIDPPKISFSCDIGKFLMDKLTCTPEGIDACKDVIGWYKQEDLYRVMEALDHGVKKANIDLVNDKTIELSSVFDNLWNNTRISRSKSGTSVGTSVGLTIVGSMAGGLVGGGLGLLVGLGFNVIDREIERNADSISERIAKYAAPNHLSVMYDFKKKYNLKS